MTDAQQGASMLSKRPVMTSLCSLPIVSALRHVLRCGTLLTFDDIEFDDIAFGERLESAALNRAEMYEAVLRAIVRSDEPEPLRIVEPLHLPSDTHCRLLNDVFVQ